MLILFGFLFNYILIGEFCFLFLKSSLFYYYLYYYSVFHENLKIVNFILFYSFKSAFSASILVNLVKFFIFFSWCTLFSFSRNKKDSIPLVNLYLLFTIIIIDQIEREREREQKKKHFYFVFSFLLLFTVFHKLTATMSSDAISRILLFMFYLSIFFLNIYI